MLYYPRRTKGKCPKLQSNWESTYLVKERLDELIYRIIRSPKSKPKVIHINSLARFDDARIPSKKSILRFGFEEDSRGSEYKREIQEEGNTRGQEDN